MYNKLGTNNSLRPTETLNNVIYKQIFNFWVIK